MPMSPVSDPRLRRVGFLLGAAGAVLFSAKAILANWDAYREKFVKVYPHEYKRALTEMAAAAQKEAA